MPTRPVSPPNPRRRKKVGFVVDDDSPESGQPLQPAVDRGLETSEAEVAAWGVSKLGAASQRVGRSAAASGTSSSYEMVEEPPSSFEPPSIEPDRCHQLAERVHGDVGREGGGHDWTWEWTWADDTPWWPRETSWRNGHGWNSWGSWSSYDWQDASSWHSWRWSSPTPWRARGLGATYAWPDQAGENAVTPADNLAMNNRPDDDPVADWWQGDDKMHESLDAATCPDGGWEHYRMNTNSEEEGQPEERSTESKGQSEAKSTRPRIPSSYPASFAALPTESYREWKRAVEMWIAGEGGLLPFSVIGPRVLSVLKGRASILTRKLSVERVSQPEGLDLIFSTLESSSLAQELSGQHGERAQREFLQCRRAPHESLDSFLMRVEAQRDLMLEEDPEFAMGERFLVGYVLDNSELTQRDRVLLMAAAGNKLSTSAVYPALRRMGPFLQGTVPIGRGLSDRPLLPELQPDTQAGGGQAASQHPGRNGRFGRAYGAHAMAESEVDGDEETKEPVDEPENDDEISAAEHDAFVAVQQGQARLKAIRQARGYYRRTEQSAGGDSAAKKRLEELMAKNPCRNCGGFGHWSRDASCPMNQAKAAAGTHVATPVSDKPVEGSSAGTSKVSAAMTACGRSECDHNSFPCRFDSCLRELCRSTEVGTACRACIYGCCRGKGGG